MRMVSRAKNEKGMTLIELLAVVVILGILSSIAVMAITGLIQKSRTSAFVANAFTLRDAATFYLKEKLVREEEYEGRITYKSLLQDGFIERIKDPDTGVQLEASDDSYVEVEEGRLSSIILIGEKRRLSKAAGTSEPVPIGDISEKYIVANE